LQDLRLKKAGSRRLSKRVQVALFALFVVFLIALVVIITSSAPGMTAGIRDINNRDDDYYKVQVMQTMTATVK